MQNQFVLAGSATPSVDLFFFNSATGAAITTLTHTTPGLSLAYTVGTATDVPITLAALTEGGAYVSGGFVHSSGGTYRLDVPAAAVANAGKLKITATALPADTAMVPVVMPIMTDNPTLAGSTPAAVASEVQTTLADEFAAIPGAVWAASTRELTAVSASIREAFADTFLARAIAVGANGGRNVARALKKLANRVARVGTTLTVYEADDTTVAYTETLTTDTNAAPITGSDPA